MDHMIDETAGQAAIAYRGNEPWHGLGQYIEADDDIDTIVRKAGLSHQVVESPVMFKPYVQQADGTWLNDQTHLVPDRKVLYRSDTLKPLAVVSRDYNVVQPRAIVEFFDAMVKSGGFSIETAGALSGGKRVWALSRIGAAVRIVGQDFVRPFMLAATSYDATMATTVKFVNERVVCHNTISAALVEDGKQIKVYHSQEFDPVRVRQDMGVALDAFEEWVIKARRMASRELPDEEAAMLTADLIGPLTRQEDVTQASGYKAIMALFKGQAIGSGLTQGGTLWQWLNACTEFIDHGRGRTADTRMNSAWFGAGDKFKSQAEAKALALVA